MRTTLDLNDTLLTQAKTRAAKENRTLTSIVEEALRKLFDGPGKPKKFPEIPLISGTGGLAPGIDPTRLQAFMDSEDEEEFRRKFGKP
jgi:hypothetical protein